VKPGLVKKTSSKALSDLFRLRSNADYDDFKNFSKDECVSAREQASEIIREIVRILTLGENTDQGFMR